jgi:hypothetical protein
MATTTISRVSLPHTIAGYNLTDSSDFTTMTAGAGNGVVFDYSADSIIVLKNDTGGAAVFTAKVVSTTAQTAYSVTITDPTRSVANGKTYIWRLDNTMFKNSDSQITVECDVAGKILVLNPTA